MKLLDLKVFREKIDALDHELVEILIKRMNLSREIAEYKKEMGLQIRDRNREIELIEDRLKDIDDPTLKFALEDVFEAILHASRTIQEKKQNEIDK